MSQRVFTIQDRVFDFIGNDVFKPKIFLMPLGNKDTWSIFGACIGLNRAQASNVLEWHGLLEPFSRWIDAGHTFKELQDIYCVKLNMVAVWNELATNNKLPIYEEQSSTVTVNVNVVTEVQQQQMAFSEKPFEKSYVSNPFQEEEEQRNRLNVTLAQVVHSGERADFMRLVAVFNQPNDNGVDQKVGWAFLLEFAKSYYPKSIQQLNLELMQMSNDPDKNLALECLRKLATQCVLYSKMTWLEFVSTVSMFEHGPTQKAAQSILTALHQKNAKEHSHAVKNANDAFSLQEIFAKYPQIVEEGFAVADVINYLRVKGGVQSLADLKKYLGKEKNCDKLSENGVNALGVDTLKEYCGLPTDNMS